MIKTTHLSHQVMNGFNPKVLSILNVNIPFNGILFALSLKYKGWYFNGKRHRENGPAIEWFDGHKEWHVNNHLHRLDGPAVEYANGTKQWYVNNKYLTYKAFLEHPETTS